MWSKGKRNEQKTYDKQGENSLILMLLVSDKTLKPFLQLVNKFHGGKATSGRRHLGFLPLGSTRSVTQCRNACFYCWALGKAVVFLYSSQTSKTSKTFLQT